MRTNKLPALSKSLCRTVNSFGSQNNPKYVNGALGGKENFEKDFENSRVKTNAFQKIVLGLGSGLISITSPSRGDMIAVNGEVTGFRALEYIQSKMLESSEGKRILEEKPRISSVAVDLEKLKGYPEGTLGKSYSNFLEKYGYTPDARNAVKFVDDLELAYVAQRYREVHDLFHTLLNMPTNMLGEVTVKWIEAIQTKLPMCAAGALFGSVRLASKSRRYYSTKVVQLESSLKEKIETGNMRPKHHPGRTSLPCSGIPKDITFGIKCVLENQNLQELANKSEALNRKLESRLIPLEAEEKSLAKTAFRNQILKKEFPGDAPDEEILKQVDKKAEKRVKSLSNNWKFFNYDKMRCLEYLVSRSAGEYVAVKRVFNEIFKGDVDFAPTTLFDFGSGVGTVEWAAHKFWGNTIKEYYCVDACKEMNELSALILRRNNYDNNPYIPNIFYRQFLPATPNLYDIVVSSFSFLELPSFEQRLKTLINLWNKTANYFVLIENGTNAGFHLVLEARDVILRTSQDNNIDCYVFAPCPHDLECPRLNYEGKRTPCNFQMKYDKLWVGKKPSETGNKLFCYLILKKGKKPPESEQKFRIVREVLKRREHVVCKVCTNEGELKAIFPSKGKCDKATYQCLRASKWGDLIPGSFVERQETSDSGEYISDQDSSSDDSDDENSSSDDSDDETDKKSDLDFDKKPKQSFQPDS